MKSYKVFVEKNNAPYINTIQYVYHKINGMHISPPGIHAVISFKILKLNLLKNIANF